MPMEKMAICNLLNPKSHNFPPIWLISTVLMAMWRSYQLLQITTNRRIIHLLLLVLDLMACIGTRHYSQLCNGLMSILQAIYKVYTLLIANELY